MLSDDSRGMGHRLDMTLAVAEALNPNTSNQTAGLVSGEIMRL